MCRQAHIIRTANIIRRSRHHLPKANIIQKRNFCRVDKSSFFVGGGWWIRTTEVNAQQIYSLPPLAAREIPHIVGHLRDPLELVIGVEPTTC